MKSVRSMGEAWSDTETDDMLTGTATDTSSGGHDPGAGPGPGALSMPNSPSLNASRLRSATACSPSSPSSCRSTAAAAATFHSPPASVDQLVVFICLTHHFVVTTHCTLFLSTAVWTLQSNESVANICTSETTSMSLSVRHCLSSPRC